MNTCPNCGKVAGLHSSILQGCMCQYSMQAPPQRTWVGLTDEEVYEIYGSVQEEVNEHWERGGTTMMFPTTIYKAIEAKLKDKNA